VISEEKYYQIYPNAKNNLEWFRQAGFGIITKIYKKEFDRWLCL